MRKRVSTVVLVVLVVTGIVAGWYIFFGPCGTSRVTASITQLSGLVKRFNDLLLSISFTSQTELRSAASEMQDVVREINSIDVPDCVTDIHAKIVSNNSELISVLDRRISDPNASIADDLITGMTRINVYAGELSRIRSCAPFCDSQ